MFFRIFCTFILLASILASPQQASELISPLSNQIIDYNYAFGRPVIELPYYKVALLSPGWEERGVEFIKWLSPSVRIGGGSGTMCYYDSETGWMYVISCGHLFQRGRMSREDYEKKRVVKTVEVFYHNSKKLNIISKYEAEVLAHVWGDSDSDIFDVSLMRFKPDWKDPWFLPIASLDFQYRESDLYRSCGCDGRSEVAHYVVEFMGEKKNGTTTELMTQSNGPRGGRSGGGLFTDDGQLIGICSRGGRGYGYWSSLNQIHEFLKKEKFDYILQPTNLARKIPVVDEKVPDMKFPDDYIPLPGNDVEPLPD